MRDLFPGYYRPSDEELAALWKDSLFVFDTNVLLNLYRYPEGARTDLLTTLRLLRDRIWIPHHVALEFQECRLTVMAEQRKRYHEVTDLLETSCKSLRNQFDQWQLSKRHAAIDPGLFLPAIEAAYAAFRTHVESLDVQQLSVAATDPIRNQIDELFNDRIGSPFTAEESTKLEAEGKRRYEQKRPPGFNDSSKSKSTDGIRAVHFANGIAIPREYGDLYIWKQTIVYAKSQGVKHLVFITDDKKDDWWWIVDFEGKKILGARPELVEEILQSTDVETFYMYSVERFLEHASAHLKFKIGDDSLAQIQEVSDRMYEAGVPPWFSPIEAWIMTTGNYDSGFEDADSPLDFTALDSSGAQHGFMMRYELSMVAFSTTVKRFLLLITHPIVKSRMATATLIVAMPHSQIRVDDLEAIPMPRNDRQRIPANIVVGTLVGRTEHGTEIFQPLLQQDL